MGFVTTDEIDRFNRLRHMGENGPCDCGMCWRGPGSNEACSEHQEEALFIASFITRMYGPD